jgi:two-component system, OmpR family, sensor kinase
VAAERGHAFALDEPDQPVPVSADPGDVAIMLDNLIENAIVYSPAGGVVTVTVSGDGVRVRDQGPGIDPAEAARVFDRFYRGSAGRAAPGGTGLGLAIVRDLAGRWRGSVGVEPSDAGTCIAVRLQAAREGVEIANS